MKGYVADLAAMVGGNAAGSTGIRRAESRPKASASPAPRKALSVTKRPPAKSRSLALHRSNEVRPNDIIPMDEDDFKDF